MKYSVSSLYRMDEKSVPVYEEGANVGTVYHRIMQYIDFFARGEDEVKAELRRMTAEGLITEEEADEIDVSLIVRCLDCEVMDMAREALLRGRCLREQPFMMYKPANELREDFKSSDRVLVQGVIDLFISAERKVLVDFKYSRLDDEKLVERYKTQLKLYKSAIESAISEKVDDVVIYSFTSGRALKCE